jgi:hypothetical protein
VSAKERLDIYGNGYQYRIIDALAAAYPVVEDYVGSLEFDAPDSVVMSFEAMQAIPPEA